MVLKTGKSRRMIKSKLNPGIGRDPQNNVTQVSECRINQVSCTDHRIAAECKGRSLVLVLEWPGSPGSVTYHWERKRLRALFLYL